MKIKIGVSLVRGGVEHQSSYIGAGDVAQIPQRDGSTVSVFGVGFIPEGAKSKGRTFTGQVARFASDGKTRLPLPADAAGRPITAMLIETGRTLEFKVKPDTDVALLIQAGPGEPPQPPAQLFDALGPTRRGDRVVIRAQRPIGK